MSDPTPYTAAYLTKAAGVAGYLEREPQPWWDDEHVLDAGQAAVWIRRLLATVDAERARADQVAAQRDALAAHLADIRGKASGSRLLASRGDMRQSARLVDELFNLIDAEADAIRRALDASPTEGNPE